jgi:hypothetical protein
VGLPWPRKPAEPWIQTQAAVLALLDLPRGPRVWLAARMRSTASGLGLPTGSPPRDAHALLAATRAGVKVWEDATGRWRGLTAVALAVVPTVLAAGGSLNEGERLLVGRAAAACS